MRARKFACLRGDICGLSAFVGHNENVLPRKLFERLVLIVQKKAYCICRYYDYIHFRLLPDADGIGHVDPEIAVIPAESAYFAVQRRAYMLVAHVAQNVGIILLVHVLDLVEVHKADAVEVIVYSVIIEVDEILVFCEGMNDLKVHSFARFDADVVDHEIRDELFEQKGNSVLYFFGSREIMEHARAQVGAGIAFAPFLGHVYVAVFFGKVDYKAVPALHFAAVERLIGKSEKLVIIG